MDTEQIVRNILRNVSRKEVVPCRDASLFESGLLDSFALVDVISALEEQFNLKIPDSDLSPRKFSSIANIESYLQARGVT